MAIQYIKKAYDTIGTRLESFKGMHEAMGMPYGQAIKVFGELKDYGLIEPQGTGYVITDLGKRVSTDDKSAVIEVLEKNNILKKVYAELKDKNFTKSYVEDLVKKGRFGYNLNVSLIAERFMSAVAYIKSLEGEIASIGYNNKSSPPNMGLFVKILKLNYALNPPTGSEVIKLVHELFKEVENNNNPYIKSLTSKMLEKKSDTKELKTLMELLIGVIFQEYPSFSLEGAEDSEENSK